MAFDATRFKRFVRLISKEGIRNCEECGCYLGDDLHGKNISHIVGGDLSEKFYYDRRNVNILCWPCHQKWEYGDRRSMRIWFMNERVMDALRREGY